MDLVLVTMVFQLVLLCIALVILVRLIYVFYTFHKKAPYVPTPRNTARLMAELADLKPDEIAGDLGSGTGTLVLAMSKRYPKNIVMGYEKALMLRIVAKVKNVIFNRSNKNAKFIKQDFFDSGVSAHHVVLVFLIPEVLKELVPQFLEMKKGARIISHMFEIPFEEAFDREEIPISKRRSVFLYTKH